jgi:hypothetical protein
MAVWSATCDDDSFVGSLWCPATSATWACACGSAVASQALKLVDTSAVAAMLAATVTSLWCRILDVMSMSFLRVGEVPPLTVSGRQRPVLTDLKDLARRG